MAGSMTSAVRTQMKSSQRRTLVRWIPVRSSRGCHSTTGNAPHAGLKCARVTRVCRNTLWNGSIGFSATCSQLQG